MDADRLSHELSVFQTSSPSYVLMASIEACLDLTEQEGRQRLENLLGYRRKIREALSGCSRIRMLEYPGADPCKIVIGSSISGWQLYERLRDRYHLQMEMAAENYVLGILSMMDTEAGVDRLIRALRETDRELECSGSRGGRQKLYGGSGKQTESVMNMAMACELPWEEIPLEEGRGRIAAEVVGPYPPGIPWAVPGERFSGEMIRRLSILNKEGRTVQGIKNGGIRVICTEIL